MNKETKAYKNKITYIRKYKDNNCKQFTLILNKTFDADIIEHLESLENKNGYIKSLIRKDMGK